MKPFTIDLDKASFDPNNPSGPVVKGDMHIELLKLWNLDHHSKTIIMVTHDIEVAIFLSDRIVVMTDGPADTIREIEEVHLPRPRNKKEIVGLPEYKIIREQLLSLLMGKVVIDEEIFTRKQL
jgi:nitrate/nitrite transport system ATP-binding protein